MVVVATRTPTGKRRWASTASTLINQELMQAFIASHQSRPSEVGAKLMAEARARKTAYLIVNMAETAIIPGARLLAE